MPRTTVAIAAGLALLSGAPGPGSAQLGSWALDRDASHLYVVTHKAGLLGFLGHEHAIVPTEWDAALCLADPVPEGAHGSLVIPTGSLVIDTDSARGLAGLGDGPGPDDRREIEAKMLGPEHLAADSFPEIRLEVRALGPVEEGSVEVEGTLSLHGVTREVALPLTVDSVEGGGLVLSGTLEIRQRDYGIEPESVARVVNVANEVDLHVRLVARPEGGACPGGAAR